MLFNLNGSFQTIIDRFTKGQLKVTGINDYGNKLIVILQLPDTPPDKSVTVVDCTSDPTEVVSLPSGRVAVPEMPTKKEPTEEKLDKQGRVVREDGSVLCRHCGRPCTARGATKHENHCAQKPM